jgi:hypothetical protein
MRWSRLLVRIKKYLLVFFPTGHRPQMAMFKIVANDFIFTQTKKKAADYGTYR